MALKSINNCRFRYKCGSWYASDLKTFQELDTYGMVALTFVVTMDKETWSHDVTPLPMDLFEKQLETAISIGPDAVKTGMLGTQEIIKRLEKHLKSQAHNIS